MRAFSFVPIRLMFDLMFATGSSSSGIERWRHPGGARATTYATSRSSL